MLHDSKAVRLGSRWILKVVDLLFKSHFNFWSGLCKKYCIVDRVLTKLKKVKYCHVPEKRTTP